MSAKGAKAFRRVLSACGPAWKEDLRIVHDIAQRPDTPNYKITRPAVSIYTFMKSSRRIPRPVDGDECEAGVRGMQSPSSSFLRCPAL